MPWYANGKDYADSHPNWARGSTSLEDWDGNKYSALAIIHTHALLGPNDTYYDAIQPSGITDGIGDIGVVNALGIPGYIITNEYYTRINPSIGIHSPNGFTSDFRFFKHGN
ncbi:MAG: hypothetical protein RIM99_19710 [Cyclobacteriaceae bacterium]